MSTARGTWKAAERRAARAFGAERQPGSGSGGRKDQTASDSTHPRLYIETKLRAATAVRKLHDDTRAKAKREGKIPVVAIFDKGRPGNLFVVHSDDMPEFLRVAAESYTTQEAA